MHIFYGRPWAFALVFSAHSNLDVSVLSRLGPQSRQSGGVRRRRVDGNMANAAERAQDTIYAGCRTASSCMVHLREALGLPRHCR